MLMWTLMSMQTFMPMLMLMLMLMLMPMPMLMLIRCWSDANVNVVDAGCNSVSVHAPAQTRQTPHVDVRRKEEGIPARWSRVETDRELVALRREAEKNKSDGHR